MNVISWIMVIFAVLGAVDRMIGNKLGLGKEFEKGIELVGALTLSMVGMIVLSPLFAKLLTPLMNVMTGLLDPSVLPAMFFANDMGGAALSKAVANDTAVGQFNGLVVAAMMGATFSFTLPYAISVVKKEKQKPMLLGLLCGIVTIPIGCFVGGLCLSIPILALLINLLPLTVLAVIIAIGLIKFPDISVKIFSVLGQIIKILVTIGLIVGIFEFLTGVKILPYTESLNVGMDIVINAMCVLAGALPLIKVLSIVLQKPIEKLSKAFGIGNTATVGLLSCLANSATTFGMMNEMDDKGIIYNAAFSVSGAFILADHLAFTLAFDSACLLPVLLSKLIAGILGIIVAVFVTNRKKEKNGLQKLL